MAEAVRNTQREELLANLQETQRTAEATAETHKRDFQLTKEFLISKISEDFEARTSMVDSNL